MKVRNNVDKVSKISTFMPCICSALRRVIPYYIFNINMHVKYKLVLPSKYSGRQYGSDLRRSDILASSVCSDILVQLNVDVNVPTSLREGSRYAV